MALFWLAACENLMDEIPLVAPPTPPDPPAGVEETAVLLSGLPIGAEQMQEVYDAVSSSSDNGFDEEYLLSDLFAEPGSGVGERQLNESKAGGGTEAGTDREGKYSRPLRDLLRSAMMAEEEKLARTKGTTADEAVRAVEERIGRLCESGVQIYWPYSENWDGKSLPVITYDPGAGLSSNRGWRLVADGSLAEEVQVDEEMARSGCVWVVNGNEDSGLTPLAYLRKTDPTWGLPDHGTVVVGPQGVTGTSPESIRQRASGKSTGSKTLLLKKFTAKRNFDTWFCGGSEFFIKIGKVEDFKGTTEADLQRYKPSITDFMVAVKRKDIGKELDFNALLVSEWTDQLSMCAFLITEDDGGTIGKWDCNAVVKINSKSYGLEISIPVNSKDDIVWRGQLSGKYINATSNLTGHFGDVDLVFEVLDYSDF